MKKKKNSLHDELKKIRNIITKPRIQYLLTKDKGNWQKLCCSLDVIDYTELAVQFYLDSEFPMTHGGKFLFSYGLLQSLFVQQKAINNIHEVLLGSKIDYKKDYPAIYDIREKRNDLVGHPTDRGNNSVHYLTPDYLNKTEYKVYSVYFEKEGKLKEDKLREIDIKEVIGIQRKLIKKILDNLRNKLFEERKKHKGKFKDSKTSDIFSGMTNYQISKLYDAFYENSEAADVEIAKSALKSIEKKVKKFKQEIENRYESIEAVPFIKIEYEEVKSIVRFIKDNLEGKKNEDINLINTVIDALEDKIYSLMEICEEIDLDFSDVSR